MQRVRSWEHSAQWSKGHWWNKRGN
jgi:hypothetical protein